MSERFEKQGQGSNAQPHLLVAKISPGSHSGVQWDVKCPYEGVRECGLTEECSGSEEEAKKWGCEPFPVSPPNMKGDPNLRTPEEREADKAAWDKFFEAQDRWRDEVHGGYLWHRTDQCWFEYALRSNPWDFEPEYYLALLPADMEINGPIKVMVGYDAYGEEVEPLFKLWEEPTNADS